MTTSLRGRAGWTACDQALSSASNFGVTVLVARATSARGFGAFALVYGAYMVVLGISSAMGSEALVIRYSATGESELREAIRCAGGAALAVGVTMGAASIIAGVAVGGIVGSAFVALGIVLPGLVLQDCWRFVFFASGTPIQAAANDLAWCAGQLAGFGWIAVAGDRSTVFDLVLAWGAGACLAAVVGAFQARVTPAPGRTLKWVTSHRDLITALLFDFIVMTGSSQTMFYLVAGVAGLSAVGALRAAETLLGPATVLVMAARIFAVPEAVRLRQDSYARLRAWARFLAAGEIGFVCLFGTGVLALPYSVGRAMLGDSWAGARAIAPAFIVVVAGRAATTAAMAGLRGLDAPRRIMAARVLASPLILVGGVGGAVLGGVSGAAVGLAVAQWAGTYVWWRQFRSAHSEGLEAGGVNGPDTAVDLPGTVLPIDSLDIRRPGGGS